MSKLLQSSLSFVAKQALVPSIVHESLEFLGPQVETEGIFRISGSLPKMNLLRSALESGLNLTDSIEKLLTTRDCIISCHEVSGVLKAFFRELPEPVVPFSHFQSFMNPLRIESEEERIAAFKEAVVALPNDNRHLLRKLMEFLHVVTLHEEQNRMSPQNLAIVFAHTLLAESANSFDLTNSSSVVFIFLLNNFSAIFL